MTALDFGPPFTVLLPNLQISPSETWFVIDRRSLSSRTLRRFDFEFARKRQTNNMSEHQAAGDAKLPSHSQDYAPYPKLDPNDVAPPPHSETWTSVAIASEPPPKSESPSVPPEPPVANPEVHAEVRAPIAGDAATTMPLESNPYVSNPAQPPASSVKSEQSALV